MPRVRANPPFMLFGGDRWMEAMKPRHDQKLRINLGDELFRSHRRPSHLTPALSRFNAARSPNSLQHLVLRVEVGLSGLLDRGSGTGGCHAT